MQNKALVDSLRKILCPTDFSEESEFAVGFAANLAASLSAELFACHCSTHPWWRSEKHSTAESEKLNKMISTYVTQYCSCADGLEWQSFLFEGNVEPARPISAFASEIECDLIVMRAKSSAHGAAARFDHRTRRTDCSVPGISFAA